MFFRDDITEGGTTRQGTRRLHTTTTQMDIKAISLYRDIIHYVFYIYLCKTETAASFKFLASSHQRRQDVNSLSSSAAVYFVKMLKLSGSWLILLNYGGLFIFLLPTKCSSSSSMRFPFIGQSITITI